MATPPVPPTTWSLEKFQALTLHSGDIISLLDAEGRLLFNSPAAERISGFSAAELEGANTFEFIHPEDQAAVAKAFQEVLAAPDAGCTVQYRYRTKAGGWTWMEAVASNQLHDPVVRGVVVISRDVTERRRAEEARARLEAQLAHRQRLEGLGTLAGGIAHDFNNLLAALTAHLSLVQEGSTDPDVLRELAGAQAAIARGAELTRQLLGFARRQPASPVALDLGATLERLRPLLARILGGRIEVALAAPATPTWIHIDPGQLEQVVVNLATNARDAMPEGGRLELALVADAAAGQVELRVSDSGVGIPPEVLPRVFEPFFTTKPIGQGTGLGLAVSHGIVSQAGGAIRLESLPGAGTTAVLRLPLAGPPAPAPARQAGPDPATWRARPGERLLLADDDEMVRMSTRRVLGRLGWEVDEARDGLEALELVAAAPGAHAAAVLDVRMPRLGGVAAKARLAVLAPGLPVVLISGFAEDADGRDDVLEKPFDVTTLGARVRRAIDGAAAPRPA